MRLERLVLASDPEKRESPYTWLGKRVAGLLEIMDGIENICTPKNHWGRHSMNYVFWAAKRRGRE